ncbi:hypothetical protein Q5H92_13060 [Hymenobacter sp. M29]|uniref:Uncharacterized protein n=1 Tax=Hymenobacter mellowenesis TaxID=3063995 RepID=A0ABT9ADQ9_9BACT|nr:hypothetical protein [Hymenobacter sp. M29]MDO7847295.1 hypothetical protein [Hymenobacter sp. M29]
MTDRSPATISYYLRTTSPNAPKTICVRHYFKTKDSEFVRATGVKVADEYFDQEVTQPMAAGVEKPSARHLDSIPWVWPPLVGRFAFARRIAIDRPDSLGGDLCIQGYPSCRALDHADSLGTDGLELVADYAREVVCPTPGAWPAHAAYPVYVANATARTKLLYGNGSSVFAVQEARDRMSQWRPLESKGLLSGNGHRAVKLRPQQMVMFLMEKYAGDFATQLRVRVQNGNSRYVSTPFAGRIDEPQFRVPTLDYPSLQENPAAAVDGLYYGAVPAEGDSILLPKDRSSTTQ